ncbi:TlpA family protein disulfide reductase [Sphingobacterium puteale]|uniref:TlpA family protein disulfide reductase n=1 Tax=Sphingobacterium puteale TaxID=2420510 RepID=UPI003D95CAF2
MKLKIVLVLMLIGLGHALRAQNSINGRLNVNLYWDKADNNDTLYFFVKNPIRTSKNLFEEKRTLKNGKYTFDIPVTDSSGFFEIRMKAKKFDTGSPKSVYSYLVTRKFWRIGDSVDIHISNHKETALGAHNTCVFSGKDALRYTVSRESDSLLFSDSGENPKHIFYNPQENAINNAISNLNRYKNKLSEEDYKLIAANINYYNGNFVFRNISERLNEINDPSVKKRYLASLTDSLALVTPRSKNEYDLINSNLIRFLDYKYRFESKIRNNGVLDFASVYNNIKDKERGTIRDRLIATLFYYDNFKPLNFDQLQMDAEKFVEEKYSREIVALYKSQAMGTKLNNFSFLDTADQNVSISDFKGKVTVIDIWSNGCGGCHILYRDVISKLKNKFPKSEVAFVSIGIDKKKSRWLDGIDGGLYTSKDAINLTTGKLGFDHPLFTENVIAATPTVILLDKEGKIVKFNTTDLYKEQGMDASIKSLL